jgi:hypothetical protein
MVLKILFSLVLGFACGHPEGEKKEMQTTQISSVEVQQQGAEMQQTSPGNEEFSGLSLTQSDCNTAFDSVSASPSAQLLINGTVVRNDPRATGVGKWSFGYAMREILELPAPGTDPTTLKVENALA